MGELALIDIGAVGELVRLRRVSPVELTEECLARIDRFNPRLNAFITVTAEAAREDARRAEAEVQNGNWRGPLHGVPIALKDLIDTAGVSTTNACGVFKDRVPIEDATIVSRLRAAGAILLGKLNMHECAYGATSVTSYFGPVRNPWDITRISGGSSGGSAAAVAAGLCYASIASDTGGSIRAPAAYCGVVGFMPTYGRVSKYGVMPLSHTLDHIGPMTRTVGDAAIVLQSIAGFDAKDISSVDRPVPTFSPRLRERLDVRVGLLPELFRALSPEVEAATTRAVGVLQELGATIDEAALEIYRDRTVFRAEAYTCNAEYMEGRPDGYQAETLKKLRMGTDISLWTYEQARKSIQRLRREIEDLFQSFDVLVTPTSPIVPPKFDEWPNEFDAMIEREGLVLRNTRPFNAYGIPSVSVPCGLSSAGLPIGLQISGPPWAEAAVFEVAAAYEQVADWHPGVPRGIAL